MASTTPISGLQALVAAGRPSLGAALCDAMRSAGFYPLLETTGEGASAALGSPGLGVLVLELDLPGLLLEGLRRALAPGVGAQATPDPLEEVERRHILDTLRFTSGNRRRAARILGIARSTLLAKIRRYRLEEGSGAETGAAVAKPQQPLAEHHVEE